MYSRCLLCHYLYLVCLAMKESYVQIKLSLLPGAYMIICAQCKLYLITSIAIASRAAHSIPWFMKSPAISISIYCLLL